MEDGVVVGTRCLCHLHGEDSLRSVCGTAEVRRDAWEQAETTHCNHAVGFSSGSREVPFGKVDTSQERACGVGRGIESVASRKTGFGIGQIRDGLSIHVSNAVTWHLQFVSHDTGWRQDDRNSKIGCRVSIVERFSEGLNQVVVGNATDELGLSFHASAACGVSSEHIQRGQHVVGAVDDVVAGRPNAGHVRVGRLDVFSIDVERINEGSVEEDLVTRSRIDFRQIDVAATISVRSTE